MRVPLAEEEAIAEKHERAGEVAVHKDVEQRTEHISVPVAHEEVHVERVPVSEGTEAREATFEEGTVTIPVREEEVEISKKPVVREEVRVTKERAEEEKEADVTLRKETAEVEEGTKTPATPTNTARGF